MNKFISYTTLFYYSPIKNLCSEIYLKYIIKNCFNIIFFLNINNYPWNMIIQTSTHFFNSKYFFSLYFFYNNTNKTIVQFSHFTIEIMLLLNIKHCEYRELKKRKKQINMFFFSVLVKGYGKLFLCFLFFKCKRQKNYSVYFMAVYFLSLLHWN